MTRNLGGCQWYGVAIICVLGFILVDPSRILTHLPRSGEEYRDALASGIWLVKGGLFAAAALALVSARTWRIPTTVTLPQNIKPVSKAELQIGLVLLATSIIAGVGNLSSSLWGDELTTLLRVVRRGPAVILSWSNSANNHILNSLLMWVSAKAFGETEVALRISAFVFGLATPQAVYWSLLRPKGIRCAALCAFAVALHVWVVAHGSEARGYAGAMLFSALACFIFARLLERPTLSLNGLYIGCSVLSIGFVATCVLVPVAHGLLSLLGLAQTLLRSARNHSDQVARWQNAVFCCLWVGVVAIVLFGVPVPQTLAYAASSSRDHSTLSLSLIMDCARYLTGSHIVAVAIAMLSVSFTGWCISYRGGYMPLSFLSPILVSICYLLFPGSHASPRLFAFLVVPVMIGLVGSLQMIANGTPGGRGVAGVIVAAWLATAIPLHWRLAFIGNPDLKGMSKEVHGQNVVLGGPMAGVNRFYFPDATVAQLYDDTEVDGPEFDGADVAIISPRGTVDFRESLERVGFRWRRELSSWDVERGYYVVYERKVSAAQLGDGF